MRELDEVRSKARAGAGAGQGSLTGRLVLSRRKHNVDASKLTGEGIPTQLGLGEAGTRTGLEAVRDELGRLAGALATWLDHTLAEARASK